MQSALSTTSVLDTLNSELWYRSSVTSLTGGCPRMVTRRYSRVKFKKCPWKSSFSRDVEQHETWSITRHGVEFYET